jgi:hypothetical protein
MILIPPDGYFSRVSGQDSRISIFLRMGANGREIFSFDSDLLPFMVNLTNREYDIILMDPRGVHPFRINSPNSRLVGPTPSPVVSLKTQSKLVHLFLLKHGS